MSTDESVEPTSARAGGRLGRHATATQVGGLLVALSLLALVAFAVLAAYADFPGLLSAPPEQALRTVADTPAAIAAGFTLYALSAALRLPVALALHSFLRWPATPWPILVTALGALSAVTHTIGLLRWPLVTTGLADTYTDPGATPVQQEFATLTYEVLDDLMSTLLIDRLTYLALAAWLLAVAVSLSRRGGVPRWWGSAGAIIAAGMSLTLLQPVVGDVYQAFVLLSYVWLLITGVLLLRSHSRGTPTGQPVTGV